MIEDHEHTYPPIGWPAPQTAPRYAPAPVQSVTGLRYGVSFDGDQLHIYSARTGTPMETIKLPDGMLLVREVR